MIDKRIAGRAGLIAALLIGAVAIQGCSDRRYGREPVRSASAPVPAPQVAQPAAPAPVQAQPVSPAPVRSRTVVAAPAPVRAVTPPPAPPVVKQPAAVKSPVEVASSGGATPTPLTDEAVAKMKQGQGEATEAAIAEARRNSSGNRLIPATNTASNDPTPVGTIVRGRPLIEVEDVPPDVAQKLEEYRMGPGDRLQIKVFGQDDISGEFEISAAGELSYPLIGQITAENMTPGEFNEVLRVALQEYFVNPQVTVEITNYRPFFILGQVGSPGTYKYQPGLNARMAIATGGGYTRRAKEEPITIFRTDSAGNLVKFDADQDTVILPGDTIEVHRRLF